MEPISLSDALKIIQDRSALLQPKSEVIPTRTAVGRVVNGSIFAKHSHPSRPLAAMDGIAVNFRSTFVLPARLKDAQWQRINTGETLDPRFNAVVKIEDVTWDKEIPVLSREVLFLQNVRSPGEDFREQKLLFSQGHILQPQDLAVLLAAGHDEVAVNRKPVISFIPTGSELVQTKSAQLEGKVLESNSAMVQGLVAGWGGELRVADPVRDDADDLAQVLKLALMESEIVVISAGTSKGTADLSAKVLGLMGEILFHGVRIHPARPALFGIADSKLVVGLPGYPASAYVACMLFLQPLVSSLSGVVKKTDQAVHVMAEEIAPRDADSFYRVQTYEVDTQTYVRRISKGAGSIWSLAEMDGLMHVPTNTHIRKRDGVRVDVFQNRAKNTAAVTGYSDADTDFLFDLSRAKIAGHRLLFWPSSAEEALQNIAERNAHFAIIATPRVGKDPYEHFEKQLQEPMERIRVFTRTVGLVTPPGTELASMPKPVVLALPRKNDRLWEELLTQTGWPYTDFQTIPTESDEEFLMDALLAGHWHAVFGDLRFARTDQNNVQRIQEHVDLVIPESALELPVVQKLLEVLKSEEFRSRLSSRATLELPK
jgi:putative molybdopterin biosynthesis protein